MRVTSHVLAIIAAVLMLLSLLCQFNGIPGKFSLALLSFIVLIPAAIFRLMYRIKTSSTEKEKNIARIGAAGTLMLTSGFLASFLSWPNSWLLLWAGIALGITVFVLLMLNIRADKSLLKNSRTYFATILILLICIFTAYQLNRLQLIKNREAVNRYVGFHDEMVFKNEEYMKAISRIAASGKKDSIRELTVAADNARNYLRKAREEMIQMANGGNGNAWISDSRAGDPDIAAFILAGVNPAQPDGFIVNISNYLKIFDAKAKTFGHRLSLPYPSGENEIREWVMTHYRRKPMIEVLSELVKTETDIISTEVKIFDEISPSR